MSCCSSAAWAGVRPRDWRTGRGMRACLMSTYRDGWALSQAHAAPAEWPSAERGLRPGAAPEQAARGLGPAGQRVWQGWGPRHRGTFSAYGPARICI